MINRIEKILNDEIRPALAAHKGNVELIDVDNDIVFIRLGGGCQGCSMSKSTLKDGIEKAIKNHFPNLSVQDVTDHSSGNNPYYKGKSGSIPF